MSTSAVQLRPLTGTAKQVAWAEQIRMDAAPVVAHWIDSAQANRDISAGGDRNWRRGSLTAHHATTAGQLILALSCTDAKFWIDARNSRNSYEFIAAYQRHTGRKW